MYAEGLTASGRGAPVKDGSRACDIVATRSCVEVFFFSNAQTGASRVFPPHSVRNHATQSLWIVIKMDQVWQWAKLPQCQVKQDTIGHGDRGTSANIRGTTCDTACLANWCFLCAPAGCSSSLSTRLPSEVGHHDASSSCADCWQLKSSILHDSSSGQRGSEATMCSG